MYAYYGSRANQASGSFPGHGFSRPYFGVGKRDLIQWGRLDAAWRRELTNNFVSLQAESTDSETSVSAWW